MAEKLSFSDAIDTIYYDGPEEVNLTHPGWTNLMPNNLSLSQEERVEKVEEKPGFRPSMRSKAKSTAWLRDIIQKLTKHENPVADVCNRTFSIA